MKRLPDSRGVRTSAEINAPRNRFAARSPAGTRVPPVRSLPVIPVVPGHRALRPPTLVIGRRSPDDRSTVLSRDATAVAGYRDKGCYVKRAFVPPMPWEQDVAFFDTTQSRGWIMVPRIAHTAHHRPGRRRSSVCWTVRSTACTGRRSTRGLAGQQLADDLRVPRYPIG